MVFFKNLIKNISNLLLKVLEVVIVLCIFLIFEIFIIYAGVKGICEGQISIPSFLWASSISDLNTFVGNWAVFGGVLLIMLGLGTFLVFFSEILKNIDSQINPQIVSKLFKAGMLILAAGLIGVCIAFSLHN